MLTDRVARHETGSGRESSTCCTACSTCGLARCICDWSCIANSEHEGEENDEDGLSEHLPVATCISTRPQGSDAPVAVAWWVSETDVEQTVRADKTDDPRPATYLTKLTYLLGRIHT